MKFVSVLTTSNMASSTILVLSVLILRSSLATSFLHYYHPSSSSLVTVNDSCNDDRRIIITPSHSSNGRRRLFRSTLREEQEHQTSKVDVHDDDNNTNDVVATIDLTTSTRASKRSLAVESFKVMDVLRRANELQNVEGKDVLHCEVGQPESGAPALVAQEATKALTSNPRQVMGYTDAFGLLSLRQKISDHYLSKYHQKVDPTRIVVTTGSSGGFLLAFTSCFDAGDVVAVASSGYPCYRNILTSLDCTVATISINNEFKLTAQELSKEIRRRNTSGEPPIKGLILSSPSNPTGAMLSEDELKGLCELCDQEQITFLSDEIYHGISYGTQEEATALQFSQNALVINSFSKYYSMAGWRLGWMILPEHLIEPINCLQQNMFINAPTISQIAAMKCWDSETIEELEGHIEKYKASRTLILEELQHIQQEYPQMNIAPADGGFYIYVDLGDDNVVCPEYGSVSMCQALLEEKYVAFTPGIDFEDPSDNLGDRRFRISYAGGIETSKQAMKRFHEFWPTWMIRVRAAQNSKK